LAGYPEVEFAMKETGAGVLLTFTKSKTLEKSSEKSSEKILALLRINSRLSARELAVRLNISPREIEKQLSHLKLEGLLLRVGGAKGGEWQVQDAPNNKGSAS
jgi:ATP-dependent DNA helicase RecG